MKKENMLYELREKYSKRRIGLFYDSNKAVLAMCELELKSDLFLEIASIGIEG